MKLSVVILGIFFNFSVYSKVIIISDIDDTIKKADTASNGPGQIYHFLRAKPHLEMRDLYNEIKKYYEDLGEEVEFQYVSAAPDFLFQQYKWLDKYNFPKGQATLRDLNSGNTYDYKTRIISKIVEENLTPSNIFFFFGDNSDKDPIVYSEVTKKYRIANFIHIRDVKTEATFWRDDLEIKRLDGINYFFSERELIDFPIFSFLSIDLREKIIKKYEKMTLIPEFTFKNLAKRVMNEVTCNHITFQNEKLDEKFITSPCKKEAYQLAESFWQDYHNMY